MKKNKFITNILTILFLSMFIFSSYKIIRYVIENKENEKIIKNISEHIVVGKEENGQEKYEVNFEELKKINKDTVGYIKVNGTDVQHIVVQGNNNDFYLYHNFEKKNNVAGWIFADYKNKLDGTDKNIIIYGHNMKNGTMFASLKNALNKDWQQNKENHYITFITENETSVYQIFSVYQIEDEDYYITTNFSNKDFGEFVKTIKSRSIYNFGVEVNSTDNILTLSTCGANNKTRIVLHGKKISESI